MTSAGKIILWSVSTVTSYLPTNEIECCCLFVFDEIDRIAFLNYALVISKNVGFENPVAIINSLIRGMSRFANLSDSSIDEIESS